MQINSPAVPFPSGNLSRLPVVSCGCRCVFRCSCISRCRSCRGGRTFRHGFRSVLSLICPVLLKEQLRPCQTETVDTLLDVPDHEPVPDAVLFAGNRRQQRLLNKIAVLILINHDLPVLTGQFLCGLRADQPSVLFSQQNVQGKMFQIRIIQKILSALLLRKQLCEPQRQADQLFHRSPADGQILQDFFLRSGKILFLQTFQQLFRLLTLCFHRFLQRLVHIQSLFSRQRRKSQRVKSLLQRLIGCAVLQLQGLGKICLEHRLILFRRSRAGQHRKGLFLHSANTLQIFLRLTHQILHPRRRFQLVPGGNLIGLPAPGKPFLRPRIAGREIIQIQNQILDPFVCLPRRITFDKIFEFRRPFRISLFQNLLCHIRTEQPDFPVLRHPVCRVQIDHLEVILNHIGAETVNGTDLRMMEKRLLTLQMIVVRILPHSFLKRLSDSLPHLPGRRPGKGYDQQLVHIDRVVGIRHQGKNPLHQNRRLSGTGRRAHQEILSSQTNHLLLFSGPFHSHVSTSSCITLSNSKSSSVFSFRYRKPGRR